MPGVYSGAAGREKGIPRMLRARHSSRLPARWAMAVLILLAGPLGVTHAAPNHWSVAPEWAPLVHAGSAELHAGRPLVAADLLSVALATRDDLPIRALLAHALARADRCEEGVDTLRPLVNMLAAERLATAPAGPAEALAALNAGDFARAAELGRAALTAEASPAARAVAGLAASLLGQCAEAGRALGPLAADTDVEDRPADWKDVYLAGFVALEDGQAERAERLAALARSWRETPGNRLLHARALAALGRCGDVPPLLADFTPAQFGPSAQAAEVRAQEVRALCGLDIRRALAANDHPAAQRSAEAALRRSGAPVLRLLAARAAGRAGDCEGARTLLGTLSAGDFPAVSAATLQPELDDVRQSCPLTTTFALPDPEDPADRCPADMAFVPAGPFSMGANAPAGLADEQPAHEVQLDGYCIDRTEVSQTAYARFIAATGRGEPGCGWGGNAQGGDPVVCVSWNDADAYCSWVGRRLPTEAEWEKAGRGPDGRPYPWGDTPPSCQLAVYEEVSGQRGCGRNWPAAVASAFDRSPYGVLHLAGNVSEWVADRFAADYYRVAPLRRPRGPAQGALRTVRGGNWVAQAEQLRLSRRAADPQSERRVTLGFRCAREAAPGP